MTDEYEYIIRSVDVWPYGQRRIAVRVPVPAPAPSAAPLPAEVAEVVVEPAARYDTRETTITGRGGLSLLGRYLIHGGSVSPFTVNPDDDGGPNPLYIREIAA